MVLLDLTGMVPSPDSILVLNWPRAFRLGCLSPWSKPDGRYGGKEVEDTAMRQRAAEMRGGRFKTPRKRLNLHANVSLA